MPADLDQQRRVRDLVSLSPDDEVARAWFGKRTSRPVGDCTVAELGAAAEWAATRALRLAARAKRSARAGHHNDAAKSRAEAEDWAGHARFLVALADRAERAA